MLQRITIAACYLGLFGVAAISFFVVEQPETRLVAMLALSFSGLILIDQFRRRIAKKANASDSSAAPGENSVTVKYAGSNIIFSRGTRVVECSYDSRSASLDDIWYLEIITASADQPDDDVISMILEGLAFRLACRRRDAGIVITRDRREILNSPATDPPDNGGPFIWPFVKLVLLLLSPLVLLIRLNQLASRVKNWLSGKSSPPPPPS